MKNLLAKLTLLVQVFLDKAFKELRKQSIVVVKVTGLLKKAVESPIADGVVNLIPGDEDDKILAKLREKVVPVLEKVAIAHGILHASSTNSDVINAVIEKLKELHPELRASFWVVFSGELNMALADGKISLAEALILAQLAYVEIFKKN